MDRRSLITRGLATVVAVGVAPAAFAAPISDFEHRLAVWRKERAIFDQGYISDEAANAAMARIDEAFLKLIHTPARHAGDIADKLDAFSVEYDDCTYDADRMAIIAADARRLVA